MPQVFVSPMTTKYLVDSHVMYYSIAFVETHDCTLFYYYFFFKTQQSFKSTQQYGWPHCIAVNSYLSACVH